MENQLKSYFNENVGEIRTALINNEPWFVARDVCKCLELVDPSKSVEKLDEEERSTMKFATPGGSQSLIVVSESGLYNLIFRSNKPEAKAFRKWVMSEVIPSIRRSGMYVVKQPQTQAEMMLMFAQNAVEMERRINSLEEENVAQKKELATARSEIISAKEAVDSFRAIFSYKDEDWREMSKYVVNEIAKKTCADPMSSAALKNRVEAVWREAYYRLTSQTRVNLAIRQRNRTQSRGRKVSKLQVIAEDNKLKKIFTGIIKEMAVQYDVRISYDDMANGEVAS